MATLPELLKTTMEMSGSDLHIATNTAPQVRVHGELQRLLEALLLRVGQHAVGQLLRFRGRHVGAFEARQVPVHADLRRRLRGDVKV